jgi:hypothetical protein
LYLKPCLIEGGARHWVVGPNKLVIVTEKDARVGYDENTLNRFPVVYMQDGQNLFFPEEAFMGEGSSLGETAWGTRLHLPLQFLNGAVARAYRINRPVLRDQPFASEKS